MAQRETVRVLVGSGVVQDDVAKVVGIAAKTLRLHYADEITLGGIEANAQVAQSLFEAATKGGDVTAAIWWLKCRAAWGLAPRGPVLASTSKE